MKRFTFDTLVPAPLESVSAFHQDSLALKRLTPPPVYVQFHEVQPMEEGSIADFTLWFGPFPVRWIAVHSNIDSLHGFTDNQARGPFASWSHKHTFSRIDQEKTRITDEIQANLKSNLFWWMFGQLLWLSLPLLFAYRGNAVRRALKMKNPAFKNPQRLCRC